MAAHEQKDCALLLSVNEGLHALGKRRAINVVNETRRS